MHVHRLPQDCLAGGAKPASILTAPGEAPRQGGYLPREVGLPSVHGAIPVLRVCSFCIAEDRVGGSSDLCMGERMPFTQD